MRPFSYISFSNKLTMFSIFIDIFESQKINLRPFFLLKSNFCYLNRPNHYLSHHFHHFFNQYFQFYFNCWCFGVTRWWSRCCLGLSFILMGCPRLHLFHQGRPHHHQLLPPLQVYPFLWIVFGGSWGRVFWRVRLGGIPVVPHSQFLRWHYQPIS